MGLLNNINGTFDKTWNIYRKLSKGLEKEVSLREIIRKVQKDLKLEKEDFEFKALNFFLEGSGFSKEDVEKIIDTKIKISLGCHLTESFLDFRNKLDNFNEKGIIDHSNRHVCEAVWKEKLKDTGMNFRKLGEYVHKEKKIILYEENISEEYEELFIKYGLGRSVRDYIWPIYSVFSRELFHVYHANKTNEMKEKWDELDNVITKNSLAAYNQRNFDIRFKDCLLSNVYDVFGFCSEESYEANNLAFGICGFLTSYWEKNSIFSYPYAGALGIFDTTYNKSNFNSVLFFDKDEESLFQALIKKSYESMDYTDMDILYYYFHYHYNYV